MRASSDGKAPAVTEGVPPCDLAEPVGDDNFAWSGAKALDVRTDFVQHSAAPPTIGVRSPIAIATWSTMGVCVASKKRIGFGEGITAWDCSGGCSRRSP